MTAIVPCPKCSQKMRVPTDKGELTVRCPSCKHSWDWPLKQTASLVGSDEGKGDTDKAAQLNDLLHYTLNTGHTWPVPRTQVPGYAIEQAKSMLTNGRHPIKLVPGGYECEITIHHPGLLATVFHGERRLVFFGVAPNDQTPERVWQELESAYFFGYNSIDLTLQKPARRPERKPWCAVVAGEMRQAELWVANFEQMIAWAWIEKMRAQDAR